MIAIVNVGVSDTPGIYNYEIRINRDVIGTFEHRRADGLGVCMRLASFVVDSPGFRWPEGMHCDASHAADIRLANELQADVDRFVARTDWVATRVVELGDYRIIITPQGKTVEHYYDDGTWDKAASGDQTLILAAYSAGKEER